MKQFKRRLRWLVTDNHGHVVFGQTPNIAIITGTVAAMLAIVTPGFIRIVFALLAFGTLFTWGWEELYSGVTPLRRIIGGLFIVVLTVLSTMLLDVLV